MILKASRPVIKRDYHIHTTFSDGTLKPKAAIRYAAARNIKEVAIVDHENYLGVSPAMTEAKACGMKFLTGIELNAFFKLDGSKMRTLHVLGYGFEIGDVRANMKFNRYLEHILAIKKERCKVLCDATIRNPFKITPPNGPDIKISVPFEELSRLAVEGYYDPGHFALSLQSAASRMMPAINIARHDLVNIFIRQKEEMMEAIEAKNPGLKFHPNKEYKSVYDRSKLSESRQYLGIKEIADLIENFGGVPVVAHPGEKGNGIVGDEIFELINLGVRGIEVFSPKNSKEEIQKYRNIAREQGLVITGGSDFHSKETSRGTIIGMYDKETPIEADPIEKIIAAAR